MEEMSGEILELVVHLTLYKLDSGFSNFLPGNIISFKVFLNKIYNLWPQPLPVAYFGPRITNLLLGLWRACV